VIVGIPRGPRSKFVKP